MGRVGVYAWVGALQLNAKFEGGPRSFLGEVKLELGNKFSGYPHAGIVNSRESGMQPLKHSVKTLGAVLVTFLHELLESDQESDDGFLAHLARPSDAVMRRPPQTVFVNEGTGRSPLFPVDVEIELLEKRGHDQIALTGQNAGPLWTADRLPAAESDQIRAFRQKTPQVVGWRKLASGIYYHRHIVQVRNARHFR
jgi:hypothetical protein